VRGWPADHAATTIAGIVIEAIVDSATPAVADPPPDWGLWDWAHARPPVDDRPRVSLELTDTGRSLLKHTTLGRPRRPSEVDATKRLLYCE
jgi:hypothetical protein